MADDNAGFIGSIPDYYDRGLGPVLFEPYARLAAERVAAAPVRRVLEIAAGTGVLTRRLREALPAPAEIVATDLNGPMLEIAKAKLAGARNVTFATADAQALPYGPGEFDAVVCQFGVMFFPDKAKAYGEARRVLNPGGRYLFSVWDAPEINRFAAVAGDAARAAFPDDPPKFMDTPFGYSAIDPIRAALHDAGFGRIVAEVAPLNSPAPDLRAFAEGLILGSPLADQIRARGRDPELLVAKAESRLRSEFGAQGFVPLRAILFTAWIG